MRGWTWRHLRFKSSEADEELLHEVIHEEKCGRLYPLRQHADKYLSLLLILFLTHNDIYIQQQIHSQEIRYTSHVIYAAQCSWL